MELTLSQLVLIAGCGLILLVCGIVDARDYARRKRIIRRCME
jgi:hypothetical protein